MESYPAPGVFRWRRQKGLESLPENRERGVVLQQGFVDLGQTLEDRRIDGQRLALPDEGADNIALISTALELRSTLAPSLHRAR